MFLSSRKKVSGPAAFVPAALCRIHSDSRWCIRRQPPAGGGKAPSPRRKPFPARRQAPLPALRLSPAFWRTFPSPPLPRTEDAFTIYDTATGSTLEVPAEEISPGGSGLRDGSFRPGGGLEGADSGAVHLLLVPKRPTSSGEGADFACDTANWLVYVPQSAMEQRWGEDFSSYYETLQAIAASVKGQVLTWEGEPICAAFSPSPEGPPKPPAMCGQRTCPICRLWQAPETALPTAIFPPSP